MNTKKAILLELAKEEYTLENAKFDTFKKLHLN